MATIRQRGRFPNASMLLDKGHDILDIIFPNEKTAHLLEGIVSADDGNTLRVSKLAEAYVEHLGINESDGHRRRVQSKLKHFTKITNDQRVTTITTDILDHYIRQRQIVKVKPDTVKGEITTIKAMLNWALETGRIDKLPVRKFPTIKTSGSDPFLFKADIDRMISDGHLAKKRLAGLGKRMVLAPPDIHNLIKLAGEEEPDLVLPLHLVATTGIRRGEMVRLHKVDFDSNTGQLTVRSGKGSRTKNRTTRTIHVHEIVSPLLVEQHRSLSKKEKWLFPQFNATKRRKSDRPIEDLRAERAARMLTDLLEGTEFELLGGWHALRHSFITICVWRGMTFEQISQWTGHIEEETQRRYTHYSGEASRKLMNDLPFNFAGA